MDVGGGVVREETGAAYILAGFIDGYTVGLADILRDAAEVVFAGLSVQLDGDDPFEAFPSRTAEEEPGLEVFVRLEAAEEAFHVAEVVEVEAEEAGVPEEVLLVPDRKGAGKGAVVELGGLVHPLLVRVGHAAQGEGLFTGITSGDVPVGVGTVICL